MNANAVAKHYDRLTPEERFRLIYAAGARGDDAEQDRLKNAGGRMTVSVSDHWPYGQAFDQLALLVFIELLDTAATYLEALQMSDDAEYVSEAATEGEPDDEAEDTEAGPDAESTDDADATGDRWQRPTWQRRLDIALATGFILKARAAGWKEFCDGMSVPPYALWEWLPGFDRLQRALTLAEQAAFVPEGMVCWLNAIRPEGEPEVQELTATPDWYADGSEVIFRKRVAWWGGDANRGRGVR